MPKTINWEDIAKRMIALSALGGNIDHFSGHRYLSFGEDAFGGEVDLNEECRSKNVDMVRSKQYGGIESCLDEVDSMLKKLGLRSLMETYESLASMVGYPEYYADPNRLINDNEEAFPEKSDTLKA